LAIFTESPVKQNQSPDGARRPMAKYVGPRVFYLYSPDGATISLWQRYIGWISQIFPTPPSFSALVQGGSLRIYGKALQLLKLEFSRQPTLKIW